MDFHEIRKKNIGIWICLETKQKNIIIDIDYREMEIASSDS